MNHHDVSAPTRTRKVSVFIVIAAFVLNPLTAIATQGGFLVQGTVRNEAGKGVGGVQVTAKGTSNFTSTNPSGGYILEVPSGNATLVFTVRDATGRTQLEEEAAVNSQTVVDKVLRCPQGQQWIGNGCAVLATEVTITRPTCPDGKSEGRSGCIPTVMFHPALGITLPDAQRLAAGRSWVMATPQELNQAWAELKLDMLVAGMLNDGQFAVPIQSDYTNIKRGANLGFGGANQGFFYVKKAAVSRTQVSQPEPPPEMPQQQAIFPGTADLGPEGDPRRQKLRMCQMAATNTIIDGWFNADRQLLLGALLAMLADEGQSNLAAQNRTIAELQIDPVRRWQFAPYMLRSMWNALVDPQPDMVELNFRKRFETWAACDETKVAQLTLSLWNHHTGKDTYGPNKNPYAAIPPYRQNTLGLLLDTTTGRGSIKGFHPLQNPLFLGANGSEALKLLYKPMAASVTPGFEDPQNLRDLGKEMAATAAEVGLSAGGVAMVMAVAGAPVLGSSITAANAAALKASEFAIKTAANKADDMVRALIANGVTRAEALARVGAPEIVKQATTAGATEVSKEMLKQMFGIGTQKVAGETAEAGAKVAGEVVKRVAPSISTKVIAAVAVIGILATFGEILGRVVDDALKTDQYDASLRAAAYTVGEYSVKAALGPNPGDFERSTVFGKLVKMTIAEPADQGQLTFALPDVKCPLGTTYFQFRTCVIPVKFHSQPSPSLENAIEVANNNGWQLATEKEVSDAWFLLGLDVYAFGRMADGRFAVPVQTNHSNFKMGPNIGAAGGNQGFFYTVGKPLAAPDNAYVRFQNLESPARYLNNQVSQLEYKSVLPNWHSAQWKLEPVHSGWVRIQNRWYPKVYLHFQNGKLEAGPIETAWASAMWKLIPDKDGAVRIQNNWFKTHYIHSQGQTLQIGPIQPEWESALWIVQGLENAGGPTATRQNVAIGKVARQSSVYPGGEANKAVDGNLDGNFLNKSVSHTQAQNESWWEVDLGTPYNIDEIRLFNRTDCCSERLNSYRILVSEQPFTSNAGSAFGVSFDFQGVNPRTFRNKARGRYVRIHLNGSGYLSLAEVQVMGTP